MYSQLFGVDCGIFQQVGICLRWYVGLPPKDWASNQLVKFICLYIHRPVLSRVFLCCIVVTGVYGFGYMEAGKNVFTLFKNRGWEAIIADVSTRNSSMIILL
jgi:hypothetical protein